MLLGAVVAAGEGQDQGVVALNLAEPPRDVLVVGELVVGERAPRNDVGAHGVAFRSVLRGGSWSAGDELLPSVDVVRRAGQGGVGHQVQRQGGDVSRTDHAPDRERPTQLVTTRLQTVAEQLR